MAQSQHLNEYWLDTSKSFGIHLGPPLLTWFNFNPTWISYHMPSKMWDEIIYLFPNFNGWSLGKDNFYPTHKDGCNYLFMLGLKLIHVSKGAAEDNFTENAQDNNNWDMLQNYSLKMTIISYTLNCEYRVVRNWYSRLLFTSEDRLCANLRVQDNRRIWHHNASNPRSCDITDQLQWRHNTKPEKTVLNDNGEIDSCF